MKYIVCDDEQFQIDILCKYIHEYAQAHHLEIEILKYTEIKNLNPEEIYEKLLKLNITDKKEIKNHVSNIKTKIKENKTLEEQMICPKCHGSLIERNGKYGPFIGCSNYPKCKFIKKIN